MASCWAQRTWIQLGAALLVLGLHAFAWAQHGGEYGARARVERPMASRNGEDGTAAATAIDLSDRPMALETLQEVVPEIPGAIAISQGGYGAFTSASLRASEQAQTTWLLGEIPLNGPESGAFDMSLLPVSQLSAIEVYRGGAPVWYGQGSIGGVVRVVPYKAEGTAASAQAGVGSYGRYELRGQSEVLRRRVSLYSSVRVGHADNDFRYWDDNGTRPRRDDDVERRMKNAQVTDGSGLMHLRIRLGGGHLEALVFGIQRIAGAPGRGGLSANALHTDREFTRGLVSLAYTREGRAPWGRKYRVQLLTSGQGEARTLDDPHGELASGVSAVEQSHGRLSLRLAGSLELVRFLEVTSVASHAGDRFEAHDPYAPVRTGPSSRHTEAVATEVRLFGRLFGMRSELRASQRTEWTQTRLDILRVQTRVEEEHWLRRSTYRVAGALEPLSGLTLRGSWGTGARVPTITELFGDGAGLKHNYDLVPERGRYVDAGFVFSDAYRELCGVLEANAFLSRVDEKISYRTNNQGQAVAENFGNTQVRGLELGGEASYRRLARLVTSTTFITTRADTERRLLPGEHYPQLPRQPKLRAYVRLESTVDFDGRLNRLTTFVSVHHVSTAFLDSANEVLRPPITHLGLGVAFGLFSDRLALSARVSDLLDARGQDYLQFPLPGRTFSFLLSYREESL